MFFNVAMIISCMAETGNGIAIGRNSDVEDDGLAGDGRSGGHANSNETNIVITLDVKETGEAGVYVLSELDMRTCEASTAGSSAVA